MRARLGYQVDPILRLNHKGESDSQHIRYVQQRPEHLHQPINRYIYLCMSEDQSVTKKKDQHQSVTSMTNVWSVVVLDFDSGQS